MVRVHHARDAVESESVKHIHVHVKSKVRKQESQNFVVPIVEQPGIPKLVTSSRAFVEVLMVGTVKNVDSDRSALDHLLNDLPIEDVLASVRVHDIEKDSHAHLMCLVDERLEFLGCTCTSQLRMRRASKKLTISRRDSEEVCDLVSEGY